jgi:cytidylate kinase
VTATTITVGGLPGTGTSTLCRLLERTLGLPYVYAGQIFRQQAAERGLTLTEFNELAQRDPSVDRALDDRQLELLRGGGLILEGRLSGWLARQHSIPALKVWLVCEHAERVRRLVARDGGDPRTQEELMRDRVERERDRYARYYGFDLDDRSIYDLVLDSTRTPPDDLAGAVGRALGSGARNG